MDYIFIDTGVFEANNFLESKVMQQLLKLAEDEEIVIVLPKITYNEILARARVHIRAGIDQFNKAKPLMRVMRNIPARLPLFDKLRADTAIAEFTQVFEDRMKQAKYKELPYPKVDVTELFTNYFEGKRPFGKGDKKHEFPDALALITVEQWCAENDCKCLVFSTDEDLLKYKSPHLEMVPDYKTYLSELQQDYAETKGSIRAALEFITNQAPAIESKIADWAREQLDDERRYTNVVNYLDVHDIDVKEVRVDLGEPKSTAIDVAWASVEVELSATIFFSVEVEIPDEATGWFDDEDREWHYFDNRTLSINQAVIIPVKLEIEVSAEDGRAEAHDFNLAEINDGDELTIEDEREYY